MMFFLSLKVNHLSLSQLVAWWRCCFESWLGAPCFTGSLLDSILVVNPGAPSETDDNRVLRQHQLARLTIMSMMIITRRYPTTNSWRNQWQKEEGDEMEKKDNSNKTPTILTRQLKPEGFQAEGSLFLRNSSSNSAADASAADGLFVVNGQMGNERQRQQLHSGYWLFGSPLASDPKRGHWKRKRLKEGTRQQSATGHDG